MLSYAYVLAEVERRNNRKAVKQLRAIGVPPHTAKKLWVQRIWLDRAEGHPGGMSLWKFERIILGGPESPIFDLPNTLRGFLFSLDAMWDEVSALNLIKAVPALQMPLFCFLGRCDHQVPADASLAYFDVLTAPSKTLIWFEKSRHEPFVDEAVKFNAAMEEFV